MDTQQHDAVALLDVDSMLQHHRLPRAELDLIGLVSRMRGFGAPHGIALRNHSWTPVAQALFEAQGWAALSTNGKNADDLICDTAESVAVQMRPRRIILFTSDIQLIRRVTEIATRHGVKVRVWARRECCSERMRRVAPGKIRFVDSYVIRTCSAAA